MKSLKEKLIEVDNGRFKKLILSLNVTSSCEKCFHFVPTIKDQSKAYRCKCVPTCIAATIHPDLQEYLWSKLYQKKEG